MRDAKKRSTITLKELQNLVAKDWSEDGPVNNIKMSANNWSVKESE